MIQILQMDGEEDAGLYTLARQEAYLIDKGIRPFMGMIQTARGYLLFQRIPNGVRVLVFSQNWVVGMLLGPSDISNALPVGFPGTSTSQSAPSVGALKNWTFQRGASQASPPWTLHEGMTPKGNYVGVLSGLTSTNSYTGTRYTNQSNFLSDLRAPSINLSSTRIVDLPPIPPIGPSYDANYNRIGGVYHQEKRHYYLNPPSAQYALPPVLFASGVAVAYNESADYLITGSYRYTLNYPGYYKGGPDGTPSSPLTFSPTWQPSDPATRTWWWDCWGSTFVTSISMGTTWSSPSAVGKTSISLITPAGATPLTLPTSTSASYSFSSASYNLSVCPTIAQNRVLPLATILPNGGCVYGSLQAATISVSVTSLADSGATPASGPTSDTVSLTWRATDGTEAPINGLPSVYGSLIASGGVITSRTGSHLDAAYLIPNINSSDVRLLCQIDSAWQTQTITPDGAVTAPQALAANTVVASVSAPICAVGNIIASDSTMMDYAGYPSFYDTKNLVAIAAPPQTSRAVALIYNSNGTFGLVQDNGDVLVYAGSKWTTRTSGGSTPSGHLFSLQ